MYGGADDGAGVGGGVLEDIERMRYNLCIPIRKKCTHAGVRQSFSTFVYLISDVLRSVGKGRGEGGEGVQGKLDFR